MPLVQTTIFATRDREDAVIGLDIESIPRGVARGVVRPWFENAVVAGHEDFVAVALGAVAGGHFDDGGIGALSVQVNE